MKPTQRILVVDDDPDVTEQIGLILRQQGFDVVTAASREEAEEALLTGRPDLAILDLMMEEQDSGFVLCHEVKKLYPGIPVIVLTAVKAATGISFEAASAEQQSWIKADRLLDKPIRPEQLINELRSLLAEEGWAAPPHTSGKHP